MKRIVYIFENGIDTVPGDATGWQARAVRFFAIKFGAFGVAVEYFSGPLLSRIFGQGARARELVAVISEFLDAGWQVVLVGHSNGADVIHDALKLLRWPQILAVHLFSAAIDSDMKQEGFDYALRTGQIQRMVIYTGGKDVVLGFWARLVGWVGYGRLGFTGPQNMSPAAKARVTVVPQPEFGHSSWWEPGANFEWSMNQIYGTGA